MTEIFHKDLKPGMRVMTQGDKWRGKMPPIPADILGITPDAVALGSVPSGLNIGLFVQPDGSFRDGNGQRVRLYVTEEKKETVN